MRKFFYRIGLNITLIIIGAISTWTSYNTKGENGISSFWIVPLVYTICIIVFQRYIKLHEGGIGLKILFGVMTVRYIVSPAMNCIAGNCAYNTVCNNWAIGFQVIEIIAVFFAIAILYRYEEKITERKIEELEYSENEMRLSFYGIFVMGLLVLIMLIRNNGDEIWTAMRFFLGNKRLETDIFDGYALMAINCMKSFIFIIIIQNFRKMYEKKRSVIWPLFGMIAAAANFMIYFGNNRSSVLQCALSCVLCLIVAFKEEKKLIVTMTIPIIGIMTISLVLIKNYGIDITKASNFRLNLNIIADSIDDYFCGINNTAFEQYRYINVRAEMHLGNMLRDITNNIWILNYIPGFNIINDLFSSYSTTIDLITLGSTAMVSVSGQLSMWFGRGVAIFADIVAQFINILFLSRLDNMVKYSRSIWRIFVCAWLSIILGMIPMYSMNSIILCVSGIPFFLYVLIKINNFDNKIHVKVIR